MTGQVKEEILTRFGELGVQIEAGAVHFRPVLLRSTEFLQEPGRFEYVDVDGDIRQVDLPRDSLAFTFCQVPIVYHRCQEPASLCTTFRNGTSAARPGHQLDATASRALLSRSGTIGRIDVKVPEDALVTP
jgi:hypothetical protein